MMRQGTTLVILLLAAFFAAGAAEPRPAVTPSREPGSQIHVYVLTFGPGDEAWEKFGHNAIRIVNDDLLGQDHDLAFNFGVFSFGDGAMAFAWRFLQGRLIYSMGITYGQPTIDEYAKHLNRSVYQQELNLSLDQKAALWRRLWGMYEDPSQRNYRYDYYTNNCCTKVRDVVDDLADHRLAAITKGVPSGTTYRWQTSRLTACEPWLYVLLNGAMGHPVDQPIDQWQEMFLPQKLHDRLEQVMVHLNGYDVPLVKRSETLYESTRTPAPAKPPLMAPWILAVSVVFGAILALLGHFARRHWAPRWAFILVSFPWLLLMGVGGATLWWGRLVTDHIVVRNNENVMQVSVLALPLIILLPMLALGFRRGAMLTRRLVFMMVGISVVGVLLKVLPWFHQVNGSIVALCLPVNLAIGYAAWRMTPRAVNQQSAQSGKPMLERHASVPAKR